MLNQPTRTSINGTVVWGSRSGSDPFEGYAVVESVLPIRRNSLLNLLELQGNRRRIIKLNWDCVPLHPHEIQTLYERLGTEIHHRREELGLNEAELREMDLRAAQGVRLTEQDGKLYNFRVLARAHGPFYEDLAARCKETGMRHQTEFARLRGYSRIVNAHLENPITHFGAIESYDGNRYDAVSGVMYGSATNK